MVATGHGVNRSPTADGSNLSAYFFHNIPAIEGGSLENTPPAVVLRVDPVDTKEDTATSSQEELVKAMAGAWQSRDAVVVHHDLCVLVGEVGIRLQILDVHLFQRR